MKRSILIAAGVVAFGLLLYRSVALERRLDAALARLGAEDSGAESGGDAPIASQRDARIQALEADLARLREQLSLVEEETHSKVNVEDLDQTVSEDRILSVVSAEAERIRDRHLEFQRDRWLEFRERVLSDFVARFGMSAAQAQQMRGFLVAEIDGFTELMKDKEVLDKPELAASSWAAILLDTDRRVEAMLTAEQRVSWQQARFLERRVLWPWLPEPLE